MSKMHIALGAIAMASSLVAADLRQGLVAYWPLDTIVDGITTPELVYGNDFEVFGMDDGNLVDGHLGKALSFDASLSQYAARITDLTGEDLVLPINRAPQFTVSLWVKGDYTGQNDRRIFSEGSTTSNDPLFNIGTHSSAANATADIFIRNSTPTTFFNHVRSTNEVFNTEWHHVVWVDTGTSGRLYVDGMLDPTVYNYTRSSMNVDTTSIGGILRASPSSFFTGQIDEVALWERTLSAEEIQDLFANGIPTPIGPTLAYFTRQPVSSEKAPGTRVTFTADAVGTRPLSFQWMKDGQPLEGETGRTLIINGVQAGDAGTYTFTATTPAGTASSDPAVLTVVPDPTPDTSSGLISYWPLNTGETNTPDLYSNNDFEFINMDASNFVPGKFGNGLFFDGFEEFASRSSGSAIYNNPNFSVAFWVQGDFNGQLDRRVFAESSGANNNPLFTFGTDNSGATPSLNVYIRNTDGSIPVNARKSTLPVFDNEWHQVTWVDRNGQALLYIDGQLDPTDFTYTRGTLTPDKTTIGGILRAGPSHWFAGSIDEVAVWNRALTYAEIQEIIATSMKAPLAAIPPSITVAPVGGEFFAGEHHLLSAEATGTSPLSFQWSKNGTPIPNATNRMLNLGVLQTEAGGAYSLSVSNKAGVATTEDIQVVVKPVTGLRTALVAHWPFETINGGATPDIVNGNDLTLVNMDESNLIDGRIGKAFTFNGTDEYLGRVHTNSSAGLPVYTNRAYTVSMWVNGFGTGQSDRRFFSEGSTLDNSPLLNLGTDNGGASDSIDVYVRNDTGNGEAISHRKSTTPALDGTWHHVVWTDVAGKARLYIDGVPDSTDFYYTRRQLTPNATSVGAILRAAAGSFFAGSVDDVVLWGRALSEVEVAEFYASGFAGGTGGQSPSIVSISVAAGKVHLEVDSSNPDGDHSVEQSPEIANPAWTGVSNLVWTKNGNRLSAEFDAPAGSYGFFRVSGPSSTGGSTVTTLLEDDFEGPLLDWTHGGFGDSWQLGAPSSGPGVAYSGENVWTVGLNQAVPLDTYQWLRSPAIDLTGVENARLSLVDFLDLDGSDSAIINIKDAADPDGAPLAELTLRTGTQARWTQRTYVLPPEALGRSVVVEFLIATDSFDTIPHAGWFIDDVAVRKY